VRPARLILAFTKDNLSIEKVSRLTSGRLCDALGFREAGAFASVCSKVRGFTFPLATFRLLCRAKYGTDLKFCPKTKRGQSGLAPFRFFSPGYIQSDPFRCDPFSVRWILFGLVLKNARTMCLCVLETFVLALAK
jgi:hypothetical protein